MANTLITSQLVSNELLRRFKNQLNFAKGASHEYDSKFQAIGDTYNLRDAVRLNAVKSAVLSVQNVTETKKPLQITTQAHVGFSFTSKDLTLSVRDFGDRYLKSASLALANVFDADGLLMAYQSCPNVVGVAGTTPALIKTYKKASAIMDKNSAPFDGERMYLLNSDAEVEIVDSLKGLFQSSEQISKQYLKGRMGTAMGGDWAIDQNIPTHTPGTPGGAPLINGAGQTGTAIVLKGLAAGGTYNVGDVITFALSFAVNPVSGAQLQDLRQQVVTANAVADGGGNVTVNVYPGVSTTGPTKTVNVSPADGAVVTAALTAGTLTPQNLVYHRDAFVYAMVPLEMPQGVHFSARSVDKETGLSIRIVSQYDIVNDIFATRADIMYGWAPRRPEWATRIAG